MSEYSPEAIDPISELSGAPLPPPPAPVSPPAPVEPPVPVEQPVEPATAPEPVPEPAPVIRQPETVERTLYVVNKSTLVSNTDAQKMVEACGIQLQRDAQPIWGLPSLAVQFATTEQGLPLGSYVIAILDDSTQQGTLGWHTESQGEMVYGEVFARPSFNSGSSALAGQYAVSSVLSHEVLETWADPFANLWAADLRGRLVCYEIADPVENHGYEVALADGTQVLVSNFVTPEYFDPQPKAGAKFDFMGVLTAPFTIAPGGYIVYMAQAQPAQQFGDEYPDVRKELKSRPNGDRLK